MYSAATVQRELRFTVVLSQCWTVRDHLTISIVYRWLVTRGGFPATMEMLWLRILDIAVTYICPRAVLKLTQSKQFLSGTQPCIAAGSTAANGAMAIRGGVILEPHNCSYSTLNIITDSEINQPNIVYLTLTSLHVLIMVFMGRSTRVINIFIMKVYRQSTWQHMFFYSSDDSGPAPVNLLYTPTREILYWDETTSTMRIGGLARHRNSKHE